jgi:hypothetical protein
LTDVCVANASDADDVVVRTEIENRGAATASHDAVARVLIEKEVC